MSVRLQVDSVLFLGLAVCLAYLLGTPVSVTADSGTPEKNLASDNYDKTQDLLPGEEVVTPTGQKMKVWSTRGPVPVARAPEPFEDPKDAKVGDIDVVIDGRKNSRDQRDEFPNRPMGTRPNLNVPRNPNEPRVVEPSVPANPTPPGAQVPIQRPAHSDSFDLRGKE